MDEKQGRKLRHPFLDYLPAVAVALLVLAIGGAASYAPPETGEMAVVFAPGTRETTAYAAVIAAGGSWVSGARFGNVAIAYAYDADFKRRIGRYGGLFTMAATGLCSPVKSGSAWNG